MNAMSQDRRQQCHDYRLIEAALIRLQEAREQNPSLAELAAAAGVSEYHFQRLFSRWAGISPKRYQQFLSRNQARKLLRQSAPVLEAAYAAGLSSTGRLHDLMISTEAVTPGQMRSGGEGLSIRYAVHASPYGDCLIGLSRRGICHLAFVHEGSGRALDDLRLAWPGADLEQDDDAGRAEMDCIFKLARSQDRPLHLLLRGTNFQLKVWEALLAIPPGAVASYGQLAAAIGRPGASRAVGSAVAANPIAYLIPCHRVIRALGDYGDYHWGPVRKQLILARECFSRAPARS